MARNKNMHAAKRNKNDEFYTQLTDIEKEMKHYREHFAGKTIYLNCDDPESSNFFRFFASQFEFLGLKKLISTHYRDDAPSYKLILTHKLTPKSDGTFEEDIESYKSILYQNGDFRSPECIELLKEADIVVTNPPFSLFREYVAQLIEYDKRFIVIGNQNAITYKEIFPLIKDNKIWLGTGNNLSLVFQTPYGNELESNRAFVKQRGYDPDKFIKVPAVCWFTNLQHAKRAEKLILFRKYNEKDYPKYDNYDGINVDKVVDIPEDYDGAMGVPITFLDKYNPDQFEIVRFRHGDDDKDLTINGKSPYFRIIIKRKV